MKRVTATVLVGLLALTPAVWAVSKPPTDGLTEQFQEDTADCGVVWPKNPRYDLGGANSCLIAKGWKPFDGPGGYWCGYAKDGKRVNHPMGYCGADTKPKQDFKPPTRGTKAA